MQKKKLHRQESATCPHRIFVPLKLFLSLSPSLSLSLSPAHSLRGSSYKHTKIGINCKSAACLYSKKRYPVKMGEKKNKNSYFDLWMNKLAIFYDDWPFPIRVRICRFFFSWLILNAYFGFSFAAHLSYIPCCRWLCYIVIAYTQCQF